jgi:phage terminase large subunit
MSNLRRNPMAEMTVQSPAAFRELFEPHRYKVYYGGRGKGASWAFARALLLQVAERGLRVLCAREYQTSIGDSVHRLLVDQITLLGMESVFHITRAEISCANGGIFLFKGIRNNPGEIKSLEGIDIAWLTEAERTTNESLDVLIPTIRKDGSEIWIDFNPDDEHAPTYQRFVLNPPPDAVVKYVTYRDNPFFPDTLRVEMEYVRRVDPEKYLWIWEGKSRRITHALVFSGKYRVEEFSHPAEFIDRYYFGADWGFAEDPTTMIRSYIIGRTLYVDHEAYGVGVELDEIEQLFASVPESRLWPCPADNARPETISHMQHHGYPKIKAVRKGAGSVEDGISQLKAFEEIVIHPRCKHTIAEFGSYSYKVDRLTGDVLPILVDKDNHCCDALRYAHFRSAKRSVGVS